MLRRYWWVNQTTNYDPEILEGRLWTSPNRHGTLIAGRKAILAMRPGDLVFHYNRGRIRALSVVATSAIDTPRPVTYPAQSPLDPEDGWAVYLDVIRSDLSVPGGDVRRVLPHGTDTLDRIGAVNRRYLSELPAEDAEALASLAGIPMPAEDSFAGRPWSEVVDPDTETDGRHWATFRREQAHLRASLLGGSKAESCAICGATFPSELLIAAHIKPRHMCTEAERRDYTSVAMLLCALGCDVLFEWGYVVVDNHGIVRVGRDPASSEVANRVATLAGRPCKGYNARTADHFAVRGEVVHRR